ncbi:hypothetical protein KY285_020152 [Solanum tuberosum]|nr:hypothetical protein KY285_020152 [Solanum tuberosum]
MVNAQELVAKRHRLGLEAEIDVVRNVYQTAGINHPRPGFQQNAGINQPRVVEDNRGEEGVVHPKRKPIAQMGRAQHPTHMMYEEDDADLDRAGATGAVVLPTLPPSVKFTITNTMIQLLNVKGMFKGADSDDANQHLMNFVAICKSQEIPGANQTTMRLRLFPLSITGKATNWLNEIPDDSIQTWNELKKAFLERFFPESKELHMNDEIITHKHLLGEAMHDT